MNKKFLQRGFTLIELIVVVAIISILAAVIYANFSDARVLAKNKLMMSELRETQLAMRLYKSQYNDYPNDITDLVPEFIANIPDVTKSANPNCALDYVEVGSAYKLSAVRCLGGAADSSEGMQENDELARCPSTCGNTTGACGSPSVSFDAAYLDNVQFYESYAIYGGANIECQ